MKEYKLLFYKYFIDLVGWTLLTFVAFWMRVENPWATYAKEIVLLSLIGLPVKGAVIYLWGYHCRSWHRIGVRDLFAFIQGIALVTLFFGVLAYVVPGNLMIPRSVPLIEGMLALLMFGFSRLVVRMWYESRYQAEHVKKNGTRARRVLIVGAGEAGTMFAREMLRHPEAGLEPVGFLDDDPGVQRQRFLGLRVFGGIDTLPEQVRAHQIDEVLIAMPSESGAAVRRVVALARKAEVDHRTIPAIYELLSGQVAISQIRNVDVVDLLRREPVRLDVCDIEEYIRGRVVLVTGAGGSIGSEIVRQVVRFEPEKVVLLGRGENSIYAIEQECRMNWPHVPCAAVIADVRDYGKLRDVFERYRPQVVFHAAAHKHVPLMEAHPDEAVLNNVGGTKNLVELALGFDVERFVNISTDKAVNPSSIMGATKRVAEYLVEWGGRQARPGQHFVSVRFGNVLGSRGSVIPLFKEQIKRGGPVTVTHADMKRYFMTIPEASQLVLQAGGLGANGNVYVLDMGEPIKIIDLARDLIQLSGFEPGVDIEIQVSGMRPGEKLYEELLTAEEGTDASRHEKIFVARKTGLPAAHLERLVHELLQAARRHDAHQIRTVLKQIIPTHMLAGYEEQPLAPQEQEVLAQG